MKTRLFGIALLGAVAMVAAACSGGPATTTTEVQGTAVEYSAFGSGTGTVVFEAGLGSDLNVWNEVASEVAEYAGVFLYNRPGYGESIAASTPRDGMTIVDELRGLLVATGHEPPYVLVGHSLGGTYMELYARTYPGEVAGLVLVDSRHHEIEERCIAAHGVDLCLPPDDYVSGAPEPIRSEMLGEPATVAQLKAAAPLADMPLIVLARGIQDGAAHIEPLWRQAQEDLAKLNRRGQLVIAGETGHHIPTDQPDLVIEAVESALAAG